MPRTMIVALAVAAVTLSLSACASGAHPAGIQTARPHPTASHGSVTESPSASATADPVAPAVLSTTPGDELLTFSGTAHSGGSSAALSFTVHSPVPWNGPGGASTLAALAAAGASRGGAAANLLDPTWDAENAVSLAVVDYAARMTAGAWVSGQTVALDLGPWLSEVPVSTTGLQLDDNGRWLLTGPGSGRIVVAFANGAGAPDPSTWGDQLQIYGFELGLPSIGAPNSYEFTDCRLDLTALGQRPAAVPEGWFTPNDTYCSAGIGD